MSESDFFAVLSSPPSLASRIKGDDVDVPANPADWIWIAHHPLGITMIWLILIPFLLNSVFKYTVTLAVPLIRFCFIYLFYIPVFSIVFLSSVYYIFFTN